MSSHGATARELVVWTTLAISNLAWCACASSVPDGPPVAPAGAAGKSSTSDSGAAGTLGAIGATNAGGTGSGGAQPSSGGAGSGAAGAAGNGASGEAPTPGADPSGGAPATGGASTGEVGGDGTGGSGDSVPPIPAGCAVSSPVSFKADIGPWLAQSCGKGRGGGCHVTDDASTANSLCPDGTKTCGFNHAYDWITAASHNQFCNQTPAPIRYTVVGAVLEGANPPSCTKTRVMPPEGPPATECQKAALAAWLALPKVLQAHRADDTSPAEPYLMPPFN